MRLETSAYCHMGEIVLHSEELSLGVVFSVVQLDPLLLQVGQLVLVRSVPMYVSNNPWVFEVNKSIVNEEPTSGRRVEDVKVSVFDPGMVEVGRGEGPSMEGSRVLAFSLATYPYEVSVFPNAPVRNVLGRFCLSFFIEEDYRVEMGLGPVIPYPPFTRVVRVLEVTSKRGSKTNRLRWGCRPSNHGLILCEVSRLVTINAILTHIWFSEV